MNTNVNNRRLHSRRGVAPIIATLLLVAIAVVGGAVRLIVDEVPDKMKLFIKRFGASEVRIGKMPSKGRIAVTKKCPVNAKLLMSDSAVKGNLHENTEAECSLFTNSDEMTDNIFTLCGFIWKGAAQIEL